MCQAGHELWASATQLPSSGSFRLCGTSPSPVAVGPSWDLGGLKPGSKLYTDKLLQPFMVGICGFGRSRHPAVLPSRRPPLV